MSRQLDAAIAEALGYEVEEMRVTEDVPMPGLAFKIVTSNKLKMKIVSGEYWAWQDLKHYSTDGNAMLELDREMRERGYKIDVALWKEWKVIYWHDNERISTAIADTEPLARALAAYKALTGKDWEGEGE